MTRIAPTLTLLAVAALGGGMFVANAVTDPSSSVPPPTPSPAAVSAPAPGAGPDVISLGEIPVAGGPAVSAAEPDGRTEISLGDVPVAQPTPPDAPADAGGTTAFAGRTGDDRMTVALAVQGNKATGYVCGGGVEAWVSGTVEDGALSLTSRSGRTVLTGSIGGSGVAGTVSIDGTSVAFQTAPTDVATARANGRPDVGRVVERLGRAG